MTVFSPNKHQISAPSKWVIRSSSTSAVTKLNSSGRRQQNKDTTAESTRLKNRSCVSKKRPAQVTTVLMTVETQRETQTRNAPQHPTRGGDYSSIPASIDPPSGGGWDDADGNRQNFFFSLFTKAKISSAVLLTLQITSRPRFTWRAQVLREQSELGKIKPRSKSNLNTYVLKGVGINPLQIMLIKSDQLWLSDGNNYPG